MVRLVTRNQGIQHELGRGGLHPPPELGLDANIGFLNLRLDPSTKSSQDKRADVVIAHESVSGLQPGYWFEQLRTLANQLEYNTGVMFRE
jgi:hypothetical protein